MKTLLLFFLLSTRLHAQDIIHGTWHINGIVITRTGSIQVEDSAGVRDTCTISWQSPRKYTLQTRNGVIFVRVDKVTAYGYSGLVTDGRGRKKWFEAIAVR